MTAPMLCWLHDDGEPDHWIDPRDRVGVFRVDCGVVRTDLPPIPAARACIEHNGIAPARVVAPYDGPWAS